MAPTPADPGEQPVGPAPAPDQGRDQVFVGASPTRAGVVRWAGRGIGVLVIAYLVLLGASLARAPWAPRISLPGLGPLTPPATHVSPPRLGAGALTTPVPPAALKAGTAPSRPRSGQGSAPGATTQPSGSSSTGTPATATTSSPTGLSKQTTTTAPGGHGTTTTLSTPSATAPGRTTTTTAAGSTTSTTRGRRGSHP